MHACVHTCITCHNLHMRPQRRKRPHQPPIAPHHTCHVMPLAVKHAAHEGNAGGGKQAGREVGGGGVELGGKLLPVLLLQQQGHEGGGGQRVRTHGFSVTQHMQRSKSIRQVEMSSKHLSNCITQLSVAVTTPTPAPALRQPHAAVHAPLHRNPKHSHCRCCLLHWHATVHAQHRLYHVRLQQEVGEVGRIEGDGVGCLQQLVR